MRIRFKRQYRCNPGKKSIETETTTKKRVITFWLKLPPRLMNWYTFTQVSIVFFFSLKQCRASDSRLWEKHITSHVWISWNSSTTVGWISQGHVIQLFKSYTQLSLHALTHTQTLSESSSLCKGHRRTHWASLGDRWSNHF